MWKFKFKTEKTSKSVWYDQFLEVPGRIFSKTNFPNLDFLKAVSVTMIANSGKMKMRKSHLILVSFTDFLRRSLPLPNLLETFSFPLKKGVGGDRKLMHFHLKIYVILFNSFCVFLLEHIDVFLMFLLLPAIKNKTIIQNKTEDRQSVASFQLSET